MIYLTLNLWFLSKKAAVDGKRQEIIVLDSKRSNAINIGLTVLPPPRTIKTAILNFDEYALNKEGIEVSIFKRFWLKTHTVELSSPQKKHLNFTRSKKNKHAFLEKYLLRKPKYTDGFRQTREI